MKSFPLLFGLLSFLLSVNTAFAQTEVRITTSSSGTSSTVEIHSSVHTVSSQSSSSHVQTTMQSNTNGSITKETSDTENNSVFPSGEPTQTMPALSSPDIVPGAESSPTTTPLPGTTQYLKKRIVSKIIKKDGIVSPRTGGGNFILTIQAFFLHLFH